VIGKRKVLASLYPLISGLAALAGGYLAARYIDLRVWQPVFPGMLVALSMLGAAVLVRLARNAPITAPTAFDDADLSRFFNSLEELNRRLFWIFLQAVAAIFIVLFAIILSSHRGPIFGYYTSLAKASSGLLGLLLIWLVTRVVAMAKGDIGFVKLQREILQNALNRQRKIAAEKIIPAEVEHRSPGAYGRAL
jgi:hypothetical protein